MPGIEVATAYISLVVSSKDVPRQINSAFKDVGRIGDSAGASLGSSMSAKLGSVLKAGALGAGAAAGGLIATALTKGMGRLVAIDTAQGKLRGLGHTAEGVSSIMENALNSVKGTAFGLGDAAGLAGTMVASGIQPGEQLEATLKRVADSAAISGSSLNEMGLIWGKAAAKGKLDGEIVAQLMERQIPIYDILAKKMGVQASEVANMVSKGKVSFQDFSDAMNDKLGGAALKMGETFKGAVDNVGAAMGRLGAAALEPTFKRMTGWLGTTNDGVDAIIPTVGNLAKALDAKVFEDWGPRLKKGFDEFKTSDFALKTVSKIETVFYGLRDAAMTTYPAIQGIGTAIAKASAMTGGGGFSLLLDVLNGLVPIISGALVPGITTLSSLMQANQGVVTGLVAAYAGFKLISFLGATKSMQGLTTATTGAFTAMRNGARGIGETRQMFATTGTQVSRLGASMAYLSTGPGSVGKMASSFRTAQTSVSRFGTALGTAAAAGTGMKIAAGGLMTAMGGPFGLAMAAGIGALVIFGQNSQKAAEHQRELKAAAEGLGKALYDSNGALNATTQRAAATALETSKLAGTGRSLVEFLESVGVSGGVASKGLAGSRLEMQETLKVLEEQARIEAEINKERVGKGSEGFASSALGSLFNIGGAKDKANEAANALADFKKLDEESRKLQESQRRLSLSAGFIDASGTSTALGTMTETMRRFEESTGGAASKIDILNGGLSTLRGDAMSVETAQKNVNDALRNFASASAEAGAGVVLAGGQIDTATAAGSRLFDAMGSVAAAFDNAGSAAFTAALQQGQSQEQAAAAAEAAGQRVRDAFIAQQIQAGKTREEAEGLANTYKLFPNELKTNVSVVGIPKAGAELDAFTKQQRQIAIDVELRRINSVDASLPAWSAERARAIWGIQENHRGSRLPINSNGSRLPTTGPGTDTTDGILGVGRDGVPTTWVDKGEWIINGKSSEKHNRLLAAINRDDPRLKNLPGFAEGGRNGIQAALSAGRSVDGNTYLWGGTGPDRFDCSGFVGWLQQIAMGIVGSVKRLYTTHNFLNGGAVAGLQPGLGPAGTQFQVGVSADHMAATIAGHAAESGGAHGTSGLDNGRANAQSSQFPIKYHLPNSMIAAWAEGAGASLTQQASAWTEKQELDLKSADVAVTQARESLAEVQIAFNEGKKSQADLDQAELKVAKAEQKVLDLQAKKDEAETGKKGPSPQAPDLAKAYSALERERLEAQMQVDDANIRRNDVYADIDATDNDRLRADFALQQAREDLAETLKGKAADTSGDYSLNGILKTYAHSGIDALFAGIEGQDYFGLSESRWLSTDWTKLVGEPAIEAPEPAAFTMADIAAQTGGMSIEQILEARGIKPPKVYDNGGWLLPGETAINLSSKPEPIFNSPGQLNQFMGGDGLKPAQPAVNDYSIHIGGDMVASNTDELVRNLRFEQKRLVYGLTGG